MADALISRGWRIDPQVGVSGFRVDLGIVHPDLPGAYLAGVECDGATYHRSAAARDRDKTRQLVLENLGWSIFRVWSPDWWYDSESAIETLHEKLNELLAESREQHTVAEVSPESPDDAVGPSSREIESATELATEDELEPPTDFAAAIPASASEELSSSQLVAKSTVSDKSRQIYLQVQLDDASDRQGRFYDDDYSPELRRMALAVVETEGPVRDDVVARRVARAHGFARTSARIKDRVLALIPELTVTEEDVGRFLWASDEPRETVQFRHAEEEDERRSLDEVSMQEILGLIQGRPDLAESEDEALAFAREIGLARLAKSSRERLESAVEIASAL